MEGGGGLADADVNEVIGNTEEEETNHYQGNTGPDPRVEVPLAPLANSSYEGRSSHSGFSSTMTFSALRLEGDVPSMSRILDVYSARLGDDAFLKVTAADRRRRGK